MTTTATTKNAIREVTPAEVTAFREQGWVKLDGLVRPEVVAEMLEWAKAERARWVSLGTSDTKGSARDHGMWTEWRFLAADDRREPFLGVALSPQMGRNAQRLIGRE